jgi:site-specific DNA-methyltransferase (cytosine-N4-specific)
VLRDCQPGIILIVFETPSGQALWADAITAAGAVRDESIDLIYTSPPYPITSGRAYGTFTETELIELLLKCAPDWKRGLKASGSLVVNLKDVWLPSTVTGGAPERSIYIDKLVCAFKEQVGLHFADRHFWRNPSCAPTTPFVTVQKVRAGCDIEHMLWFSKTGRPFADATQVMEPAKPSTVASYLAKARRNQRNVICESGQSNVFEEQLAKAARGEQIRVLPRSVQTFANSAPQVALKKLLKAANLPPHPARMPIALAKFWINFLTRPGDEVRDFFGGSLTTGVACEELGRNWVCIERALDYILGGALRFDQARLNFEGVR